MKRLNTLLVQYAAWVLYLGISLPAMAQTYVNKEWAETIGLPANLDWSVQSDHTDSG